jgi:hypothetical protein
MLSNTTSLSGLVSYIIGIINLIIPVLVTFALVLLMYAGFRYILKASESHGKGAERAALMWGLVALFVIVSVWGLLRIMCITLLNNSSCRSSSPTVQQ